MNSRSKNKLVSIAMATYNGEKFLKEQLDSIYNQTYKNIEVIVCDDFSKDSTVKILEEYRKNYGLKYFINDINLGFVKNFEKAISLCTGEFIALSDQDDVWLPNKIEVLLDEIGDNYLIHSDALLIDENGYVFSNSYSQYSNKMTHPRCFIDAVINGYVTGCTSMFRKDFINMILPFSDNLYVHDKWMGVKAFELNKVIYLDAPLIKYRQHESNLIGAGKASKLSYKKRIKGMLQLKSRKVSDVYISQLNNQYNFISIVLKSLRRTNSETCKLEFLSKYYSSLIMGNNFKAFYIRFYFFRNFDVRKPLKTKIFNMFRLLIR
jgi:glycosyltransferase involved in cell wall biosynthesis